MFNMKTSITNGLYLDCHNLRKYFLREILRLTSFSTFYALPQSESTRSCLGTLLAANGIFVKWKTGSSFEIYCPICCHARNFDDIMISNQITVGMRSALITRVTIESLHEQECPFLEVNWTLEPTLFQVEGDTRANQNLPIGTRLIFTFVSKK